jgi:hypothetical protein
VLLQLDCAAGPSFLKEVCEAWNFPSYCGVTGDSNSVRFGAQVPLIHTVQINREVCMFSVLTRGHQTCVSGLLELMQSTGVPPYPWVISSKSYRSCMKLQIIPNAIYYIIFV